MTFCSLKEKDFLFVGEEEIYIFFLFNLYLEERQESEYKYIYIYIYKGEFFYELDKNSV